MYAHCLFCNAHLGRNEALEAFPVGRRLAYDAEKGRLWVVCPRCARWNLTPLEERWEAIEHAERLYRGTRLRASTENVGLARVADGTELVRVGHAPRPEFAGWRYGPQLTARRWRYVAQATPAAVVSVVGGVTALGTWFAWPDLARLAGGLGGIAAAAGAAAFGADVVGSLTERAERTVRHRMTGSAATVAARVRARGSVAEAPLITVRRGHLAESSLDVDADGTLALDVRHDGGRAHLRGRAAFDVAAALSPSLNPAGATPQLVADAVNSIAARDGPERYLAHAGRWIGRATRPMADPPARWAIDTPIPDHGLYGLTQVQRLALEMVLHEEAERRALVGELDALEQAWRNAEEIAAIADSLVLPRGVEAAWDRLRSAANPFR